jgi:chloride channel 3/4/5
MSYEHRHNDDPQGVFGAYFSKLNHRWSKNVRNKTWLIRHPVLEVMLVCFLL